MNFISKSMKKNDNLSLFGVFSSKKNLEKNQENKIEKNKENKIEKINACFILDKKSNNLELSSLDNSSKDNAPILFNKKSYITIDKPMRHFKKEFGFSKHFTPPAQEWHNSVCSYNYTYYKSLPVRDRNLFSLLKSYFNLQKKGVLTEVRKKRGKKKAKMVLLPKLMPIRYRRLSICRTFIGKGDIKHTNKKAILTFYVYDLA